MSSPPEHGPCEIWLCFWPPVAHYGLVAAWFLPAAIYSFVTPKSEVTAIRSRCRSSWSGLRRGGWHLLPPEKRSVAKTFVSFFSEPGIERFSRAALADIACKRR